MIAKAQLSKALKNPESNDFLVYLSDIEETEDEGLRTVIMLRYQLQLIETLQSEITPEYIPFPDKATSDEESEVVQARKDAVEEVQKKISEVAKTRTEKERARIEALDRAALVKEAIRSQSDLVIRERWSRAFQTSTILLGTRTKSGSVLFKSAEEVESVPSSVRSKLYEMVLEVTSIDQLGLNGQSSTG